MIIKAGGERGRCVRGVIEFGLWKALERPFIDWVHATDKNSVHHPFSSGDRRTRLFYE